MAAPSMNDDALKESLQDLYEDAPCGYVFTAPDGAFVRVNRTFMEWTGFSRDELLARRFQDLLTVPGKIFYENQYDPLLRMQGSVREVTFDLVCADGSRLPMLVNSVLRTDSDGAPPVVASTLFSAVDRRAYERELLRERMRAEHLADVVTASIDAIITCAVDSAVQSWNGSAERLFGYSAADLPRLTLRDLLPYGGDAGYEEVMDELRAGRPVRGETVAVCSDGKPLDVSVSIAPHAGELGAVQSVSAIVRDISERKAVERLQQEFLAMASHELRTPLAVMQGQAQLMQRRGVYNERGIETILAQTRALTFLIDDLLLASQIESDHFGVRLTELDLVAAARAAVQHLVNAGGGVGVHAPDHPITIRADRQRLGQVFANLLTNAVKYSPPGGQIEVRIDDLGDAAEVAVIDHGRGIAPEAIPYLFQRFYRAPDVVEGIKGTGLGLYITRRIVEAHGGSIEVESEVGKGSTFRLRFPTASTSERDRPGLGGPR